MTYQILAGGPDAAAALGLCVSQFGARYRGMFLGRVVIWVDHEIPQEWHELLTLIPFN